MKHEMHEPIRATIENKEGRYWLLRLTDQQVLKIPIHSLSRSAHVGDTVELQILTEVQAKLNKTELAQHILEEIFNGA